MSDSTLSPNSDRQYWPEIYLGSGFACAFRMFNHWDTYVDWCVARDCDVFTAQSSHQPTVEDINRAIGKDADDQGKDVGDEGFVLWSEDVLSVPWPAEFAGPDGYGLPYDSEFTEDNAPAIFRGVYATGFLVWTGYRIMLAQQVWRCFHYGHRAGAGNFEPRQKQIAIYPGHPDYVDYIRE